MKHIIVLGDGMADWKVPALGGKTLLQYAHTPNMDRIARMGRCGLLQTVPEGFHPGSEVANSAILGYDQHKVYEGRGPLEAASIGVELADDDLALRCNLICIEDGKIKNHSCGRLDTEDADVLVRFLQEKLGNDRIHFYTGVQYRHLLVIKGGDKRLRCTPPHDVPGTPFRDCMVEAEVPEARETADLLNRLILESQQLLAGHPLNLQRKKEGRDPANSIWPWGGGYRLYDTNYEGKAQAAIEALEKGDFVYLHVEASDEAGHDGDVQLKLQTIENLDRRAVGPIMEAVKNWDEPVAIAVLPDHPTPCAHRTHTADPVPFAIYYPGIEPDSVQTFDEEAAKAGSYGLLHGDEFIREFMKH